MNLHTMLLNCALFKLCTFVHVLKCRLIHTAECRSILKSSADQRCLPLELPCFAHVNPNTCLVYAACSPFLRIVSFPHLYSNFPAFIDFRVSVLDLILQVSLLFVCLSQAIEATLEFAKECIMYSPPASA